MWSLDAPDAADDLLVVPGEILAEAVVCEFFGRNWSSLAELAKGDGVCLCSHPLNRHIGLRFRNSFEVVNKHRLRGQQPIAQLFVGRFKFFR